MCVAAARTGGGVIGSFGTVVPGGKIDGRFYQQIRGVKKVVRQADFVAKHLLHRLHAGLARAGRAHRE